MEFNHLAGDHSSSRNRSSFAPTRRRFLQSMLALGVLAPAAFAKSLDRAEEAANARLESERYEREGLAEPFRGLTTNGTVVPDLYSLAPTGVPADAVRSAAAFFLSTLSDQQIVRIMFPVDDPQWRNWANQNYFAREGVSLRDMTPRQKEAALALMRVSLNARGFSLKGTGFSPYVEAANDAGGFSPEG
jgi:hypothetical protein